jgi:hypothetical protein
MKALFSALGLLLLVVIMGFLARQAWVSPHQRGVADQRGSGAQTRPAASVPASGATLVQTTGDRLNEALQAGERRNDQALEGTLP